MFLFPFIYLFIYFLFPFNDGNTKTQGGYTIYAKTQSYHLEYSNPALALNCYKTLLSKVHGQQSSISLRMASSCYPNTPKANQLGIEVD